MELGNEALVELVLRAFRIVHGGMVAVVGKMTCGDETVPA